MIAYFFRYAIKMTDLVPHVQNFITIGIRNICQPFDFDFVKSNNSQKGQKEKKSRNRGHKFCTKFLDILYLIELNKLNFSIFSIFKAVHFIRLINFI